MKQLLQKISAISMAFVVLFSTFSFTISEHYCGNHLVDSALFSKAESCGMDMENPTPTKDCSIKKSNCCSDVVKQIEGQDELQIDFSKLTINQQKFIASFTYSYINLFDGLENNIVPFKYYSPPLLVKDIQILDEVFII